MLVVDGPWRVWGWLGHAWFDGASIVTEQPFETGPEA
jgi:hypothetical protein